jgi:chromate transporter
VTTERPTTLRQLRAWVAIGSQSVGGGPSTLYLMRSILVRNGWVDLREFMQDWTLSRLSPGNTLTALSALLGHRIGGRQGVPVALIGMLVPSAIITMVLTGGFGLIRNDPAIQSALAGVAPITIGMMLGITGVLLRSVLQPISFAFVADAAVFVGAFIAGWLVPGATIVIIVTGAVLGALLLGRSELPQETVEDKAAWPRSDSS